jgi:hypothetical protein
MQPKEKTIHLLKNDTCETCYIAWELQHVFIGHAITKDFILTLENHLKGIGCECKVEPPKENVSVISVLMPKELICENYKRLQNIIVNDT